MQDLALCGLHGAGKSRSVPVCPLRIGTVTGKWQLISVWLRNVQREGGIELEMCCGCTFEKERSIVYMWHITPQVYVTF